MSGKTVLSQRGRRRNSVLSFSIHFSTLENDAVWGCGLSSMERQISSRREEENEGVLRWDFFISCFSLEYILILEREDAIEMI